ncbi:MAG: LssY C-terminal domain-containing protein [Alphaproteobacteria bacterium]|nr:LssY C-terminal domain-containing protein [Alphaproteobacteria bacterium]
MPHTLDQILPSLQSLGLWTYWIIGLFAMLEAIVLTGVIAPGGLVVIAGGMLAQRGIIDFFDMAWFVAAGALLGSEISFYFGRLATVGLNRRTTFATSRHAQRAVYLLQRYGGLAMVIGRFFGPLSAFVPFAAAMAGMAQRKFRLWNMISVIPYALVLPGLGYFSGRAIGTLGAAAPRILAFGLGALVVLALLWLILRRLRRALPLLADIARSIATGTMQKPWVQRRVRQYPRLCVFLAARFGTGRFQGLTTTVLSILFLYIAAAYVDSVFDFLGSANVTSTDTRVANILYALRDPRLVAIFGWITDIGGRHGVISMLVGTSAALLVLRRFDLLGGLWIAAVGNQITVTLLKGFFNRPRSGLGYFVETSGSFPSGHAAGAVAVWSMMFYLAWRTRLLSSGTAATAAITAVFLIGLSRIYLIEHYVSDVLNGYLVGALWLILGIAFCEWRRGVYRGAPTTVRSWAAFASVAVSAAIAIILAFTTVSPLNARVNPPPQTIAQPSTLLTTAALPGMTETLAGDPRQHINLIVTAANVTALMDAMQTGGWSEAPRPGPVLLATAAFKEWTGRSLPNPLVIPTFWIDRPDALAFALPTKSQSDDVRLHARFWDSNYRTGTGERVFVGTLTREDPLEWALTDNSIMTSVVGELDMLAADLRKTGISVDILP